ncbi:hypothetical protein SAMN04487977_101473 [Treponema bryantii]|uniref:Phage minor structural protein GP20 n=1 Tax=Treponema bryantii TaxID=163 RepID=A0A1H9AUC2_9SPIR|nr:hypothetical protein [Treponema bryantii]SEP80340.1 hypothetical protein SAMN04487977_101473 [Treponema bryantii]
MLNEEFLTGLLGNEEVSAEDKIKQILAEHEADTNAATVGLVKKRDELLGKEQKFKEQIASFETEKSGYESKIAELNGLLEKATAGDKKAEEYYNTKLAEMQTKFDGDIEEITKQRDYYLAQHISSLEEKAFEKGLEGLEFVPGLKEGFIARIRMLNSFEPTEVDGGIKFLNKDNRSVEDVIKAFSMTPEGKAYIANTSTGGGARGDTGVQSGAKTMTREEFSKMQAENPTAVQDFFRKGGKIEG